jgi:hypothetical protein
MWYGQDAPPDVRAAGIPRVKANNPHHGDPIQFTNLFLQELG